MRTSQTSEEPNKQQDKTSIFERYYRKPTFKDRFLDQPNEGVDVIIPIIHTNELWESNLLSFYREIPINRLLISDGGCIDNSVEVVKRFPRVEVLDHKEFKSLGYCVRKLIEAVETEWFIYLHSDVFLPDGWYDVMKQYKSQYDWFGCPQQITALAEYYNVDKIYGELRPYAGSQIGRKGAFVDGLSAIDDDYVYRQEDLVFADVVEKGGFRNGWVDDIFHYHQVMYKKSPWARTLKRVTVEVEWSEAEVIRQATTQIRGFIKYLEPKPVFRKAVEVNIEVLMAENQFAWDDFICWVQETNPKWKPYLEKWWASSGRRNGRIMLERILRRLWTKLK